MLLGDQNDIRAENPMPVHNMDDSSTVTSVSAETVTFFYNSSGTLTAASGQASGTVIYAKLVYDGVLNALSSTVGNGNDSGFAFVTGTVLTTKVTTPGQNYINGLYQKTLTQKFTDVGAFLSSGEYFIDHANGCIWGKAAALVASDTCNYKVKTISANVTVNAGDIEIGSVELKDATSDTRAVIKSDGTNNALVVTDNQDKGAGNSSSTTQRVVVASDQTAFAVNTELPAAAVLADATVNPGITSVGAFIHGFNGTTWDRIRTGLTAAVTSVVGYLNTLPFAKYNATPPAPTDGQSVVLQADSAGNLKETLATLIAGEDASNNLLATMQRPIAASTYSWLAFQNLGANITLNVKATAGNVGSCMSRNTTAGTLYFGLWNTATTASGAPAWIVQVPAGQTVVVGSDFFGPAGMHFTTGIAFGMSTSSTTYVAAADATDGIHHISYI